MVLPSNAFFGTEFLSPRSGHSGTVSGIIQCPFGVIITSETAVTNKQIEEV